LRNFLELESTDDTFQGANDEVYLSAVGTDSAAYVLDTDLKPRLDLIKTGVIGDVSADEVRDPWAKNPHVLVDFDLLRPGDWPRTYTCTLLIVEHDNEDVREGFEKFNEEIGGLIRTAVVTTVGVGAGAAAGAAAGSVIPGIGNAVGAAVGAIGSAVYDSVIKGIKEGFANEIFRPRSLTVTVDDPAVIGQQPEIEHERSEQINEHGANYVIVYDWHAVP
jgi:hypothetical protein